MGDGRGGAGGGAGVRGQRDGAAGKGPSDRAGVRGEGVREVQVGGGESEEAGAAGDRHPQPVGAPQHHRPRALLPGQAAGTSLLTQIHLLLELVPQAETLQDFIRRCAYDVPGAVRRQVAQQVIEALCYLHSVGVAHRDIKTDNVILGAGGVLKLIDFGFATTVARGESHCGTPNYMAP